MTVTDEMIFGFEAGGFGGLEEISADDYEMYANSTSDFQVNFNTFLIVNMFPS